MKIAFTHNLQLRPTEEEAEFDTPKTVESIRLALTKLGHEVDLVEVSGPASRSVARLEALNPDLIFNTAEGRHGKFREAFYPGLFDQLGIPHTGSDAYTCAVTLDKHLTKRVVEEVGVLVPKGRLILNINDLMGMETWTYPLFMKPNFEGSSKGISEKSIIQSASQLKERVQELLERYPSGILVEEFIAGKDVTVPWLEKASESTKGVLPPVEYIYTNREKNPYSIYDFDMKQLYSDFVEVRAPADIPASTLKMITEMSQKVIHSLHVEDLARMDFRVTPDGKAYFLEINALPSLEPGASLYASSSLVGLNSVEMVLGRVIESACERYNLQPQKLKRRRSQAQKLKVGLTFNLKRYVPEHEHDDDTEAEFDSPKTVEAIQSAIASYGHEVVLLEANAELPHVLQQTPVDVVFNIAEGLKGKNREAQIPALLELMDIPYTGSDPAALAITLDKALAKRVVREAGLPTAKFFLMHTGRERIPKDMPFPLIVKPVAEGSSKGVLGSSVVRNESELRDYVMPLLQKYHQPALVEEFLPGREFTVALLGERRPKVFPAMEIIFHKKENNFPIYTFADKLKSTPEIEYVTPAQIEPAMKNEIERVAKGAFTALGCRDVARIDLRCGQDGKIYFIECNPLPGLTPEWSDLCIISQAAGLEYRALIGEILAPAIRRMKQKMKESQHQGRERLTT